MMYDQLPVSENRSTKAATRGGDAAARVLAEAALAAGLQKFVEPETVAAFLARVEFVAKTFPESSTPALNDDDVHEALIALCDGLKSFAELRTTAGKGGLIESLRQRLNSEQRRLLDKMAPEFVVIAGRRRVRVNYETGKQPWIESRLQDFFGMETGPVIAGGRTPLVIHLLAPNHRPVQVTTDLAGFWRRIYPQVRKELSRRYPRHAWPEDPLHK
jgi:ATP-dependent helicase HrpB